LAKKHFQTKNACIECWWNWPVRSVFLNRRVSTLFWIASSALLVAKSWVIVMFFKLFGSPNCVLFKFVVQLLYVENHCVRLWAIMPVYVCVCVCLWVWKRERERPLLNHSTIRVFRVFFYLEMPTFNQLCKGLLCRKKTTAQEVRFYLNSLFLDYVQSVSQI